MPTTTLKEALKIIKCVNKTVEACNRSLQCDNMLPVEFYDDLKSCEAENGGDGFNCPSDGAIFPPMKQVLQILNCDIPFSPEDFKEHEQDFIIYEKCMKKLKSDLCPGK
nr:uncharacterized protein LOC107441972 [Parasteatoda tepidariorum]